VVDGETAEYAGYGEGDEGGDKVAGRVSGKVGDDKVSDEVTDKVEDQVGTVTLGGLRGRWCGSRQRRSIASFSAVWVSGAGPVGRFP